MIVINRAAIMYGLRKKDLPSVSVFCTTDVDARDSAPVALAAVDLPAVAFAVFGSQSRHRVRPPEIGKPHFAHLRMVESSAGRTVDATADSATDLSAAGGSNKDDFSSLNRSLATAADSALTLPEAGVAVAGSFFSLLVTAVAMGAGCVSVTLGAVLFACS